MPAPIDLTGKHVVVGGGSLGLGLASARACCEAGATVTIFARHEGALEEARRELDRLAAQPVHAVAADTRNPEQLTRLFADAHQQAPVTGYIHAAGVYGPIGPSTDVPSGEWWDAMEVNLFGTFLAVTAAARCMGGAGGRIAVFAGGGASAPFPRYTSYAAAKAAVVRLVETLAVEWDERSIEVNAIAPGMVATRMHEATLAAGERAGPEFLERTRQALEDGAVPAEVGAEAAAFLVSDAARGITGRLVAAVYDDYRRWPDRLDRIAGSELFTLRRIVPADRGEDWQ